MGELKVHIKGKRSIEVTNMLTAHLWKSGQLDVFATPVMVALVEATCLDSVQDDLGEGMTTVGTRVEIDHVAPTPVGMAVVCQTELIEIDRRRLVFQFVVTDDCGVVGKGLHERFIVDAEAFTKKAYAKKVRKTP